jgi:hypothetical protein
MAVDDIRRDHRPHHDDIACHSFQKPLVVRVLNRRLKGELHALDRKIMLLHTLIAEGENLHGVGLIFQLG